MAEQSGFNRIPVDIAINILLRLAVTDLLKLKWVSRYWYKFIGGYDFIKLHLQHVLDNSDQLSHKRLLFYVADDDQSNQENPSKKHIALCSAYLDPIIAVKPQATLKFKRLSLAQRNKQLKCSIIVGSCNGIVCLCDDAGNAFTLLNPTTGSHRDIEGNDITTIYQPEHKKFLFGFSYDSESDDYKVVKVTQSYTSKWCYINVMVYSLRNKHWKTCRSVKRTYRLLTSSKRYDNNDYTKREENCNGISCNNALHWLAEDKGDPNNSRVIIVSFDLRNNEFRCHEDMPSTSIDGVSHPSLAVINGSLHLMTDQGSQGVDVWVMKEYGVAESSWRKLGTTQKLVKSNLPRLISLSEKRNEMVFHWDQGSTIIISLTYIASGNMVRAIQWVKILPDDDRNNYVSQPYIETLVTLQDHDDRDGRPNKRRRKR